MTATPAPDRARRARANRRNGRAFELRLAKLIGARCSQALSGDCDLDLGWAVGEAKRTTPKLVGQRLRQLLDQLDKRDAKGRDKFGFIELHQPGKRNRIIVVCDLNTWIGRVGLGDYTEGEG